MKIYFPIPLCRSSLTMPLSFVLLLTAGLQVSAGTNAQNRVSFTGKDVSLEQVFASVKKQTGYTFVYYTEVLQTAHRVSIDVKDLPIEEFLDVCLKDEPLTYRVVGQTVMITRKEGKSITVTGEEEPGAPSVKGRVTDEKQEPLAGASVVVKGSNRGTVTAADGTFSLKDVGPGKILVISYTGLTAKEIRIGRDTNFALVLQPAINPLDQAQVIAYGTTTERFNTGNISTINAKEIGEQPVSNPLLTLEGKTPGLFVTQSTGMPGSAVTPLIQGQNSIGLGNDPFYVIDGVPYTSELLQNLGSVLGTTGNNYNISGSPMSFIDPDQIESITILKDADATAIYGSRAANGAILITTKRGKPGKMRADLNLKGGIGQVGHMQHLLNTQQFLQMRHEAINNDGLTTQSTDYDINGTWDTTRYTNWQKALIGGTAQYSDINANISGGTINTQYLFGGTFHRETTVFPGSSSDEKGSVHFNVSSSSLDQKLKLQFSGSYLIDNNQLPSTDLTYYAETLSPDAPKLYSPSGSLNWAPDSAGNSTWTNPMAFLEQKYQNKTKSLMSNAILSYQVIRGLSVQSSFGYSSLLSNESIIYPWSAVRPENQSFTPRTVQMGNSDINSWIIEPSASYKKPLGQGKLEVLVGSTIQRSNSTSLQLVGTGFNSDAALMDIAAAAKVTAQSQTANVYKYTAAYGRINYNWRDECIIDLTGRRDGSSRFGSSNQFHDFGAVGLSWIFTRAAFFSDNLPFLNFGKLRGSYGTTGNDQIGDYQFLSLFYPTYVNTAYQQTSGLVPLSLSNPYLEWEATKKLQIGMDLAAIKDRISIMVNYYRNRSSNELLAYNLPITTGFSSINSNFPATVQNTGWEFTLKTENVKSDVFKWTSNFNLTLPRNKLVAFPNLASSNYANFLVVGKPINIVKTYHYLGVDPQTGVYQFSGGHGTPTPMPDTNAIATQNSIVDISPRFYGGFENTFTYKGFSLNIFFQFVKRRGVNYYFGNHPGNANGYAGNQPVSVLDRWQQAGDNKPIQRFNSDYSIDESFTDVQSSDRAFTDASYVRLRNISFSWQVPKSWSRKMRLDECRFYCQAQNLFTITKYEGLDPESLSSTTLPPLRVVVFGLQVGL